MDTFSNRDAIICGVIAVIELVIVFIYLPVSVVRLRNKIVSMGRLIPSNQILLMGASIPVDSVVYPPARDTTVLLGPHVQVPVPSAPGQPVQAYAVPTNSYDARADLPPPYSQVKH